MTTRHILAVTAAVLVLATASGCAVTRGQEPVGAHLDDTAITAAVKARFVDNKTVDASAIGVVAVKNEIAVRP